jgi:hypothetical protein
MESQSAGSMEARQYAVAACFLLGAIGHGHAPANMRCSTARFTFYSWKIAVFCSRDKAFLARHSKPDREEQFMTGRIHNGNNL